MIPTVRAASAADAAFLSEMLVVAADWRPGSRVRSIEQALDDPGLAHYVEGWPTAGDAGAVAEIDGIAVGAAWWRYFPASDPGYGFVDETVPEVAIGVAATSRGRGCGTLLMSEMIAEATSRGIPALSLSVEAGNPAVRLYERVGFRPLATTEGSITMVLAIRSGWRAGRG
jgi:ribosomal protein S18 acetylase RimI-like enzyme